MGAHFEALNEPVLMAPSDSRYTQVGFNLISVQVCFRMKFLYLVFRLLVSEKVTKNTATKIAMSSLGLNQVFI